MVVVLVVVVAVDVVAVAFCHSFTCVGAFVRRRCDRLVHSCVFVRIRIREGCRSGARMRRRFMEHNVLIRGRTRFACGCLAVNTRQTCTLPHHKCRSIQSPHTHTPTTVHHLTTWIVATMWAAGTLRRRMWRSRRTSTHGPMCTRRSTRIVADIAPPSLWVRRKS